MAFQDEAKVNNTVCDLFPAVRWSVVVTVGMVSKSGYFIGCVRGKTGQEVKIVAFYLGCDSCSRFSID